MTVCGVFPEYVSNLAYNGQFAHAATDCRRLCFGLVLYGAPAM